MREDWSEVDRRTLHERVAQEVRERLMEGALRPGSSLPEAKLAKSLQVSRGTIRDALRQLQREGLVVWEARRPPKVRRLGPREIREVYDVRQLLEGRAAVILSELPDAARHPVLARLEAALQELVAARRAPTPRRIGTDLAFHELLCELSGNSILLDTWNHLGVLVRLILIGAPPAKLKSMAAADHADIVDAIRQGDGDAAVRALTQHFQFAPILFADSHEPVIASEPDPERSTADDEIQWTG